MARSGGAGAGQAAFAGALSRDPTRVETLARLDVLSRLLDSAFVLPGTNIRFGLDGIIGLVPGIGDLVSAALSSYIVFEARRLGLPRRKLARMVGNVAFDAAIGIVPFLGDAADVLFKANRRNVRILREHLEAQDRQERGVVDANYRVVERPR